MKEQLKLVLVLSMICLVSGILMALVYNVTAEPIARAREAARMDALRQVLPASETAPELEESTINYEGRNIPVVYARHAGELLATVLQVNTPEGYAGDIELMVGILPDGSIQGVAILDHKETPGLGAHITGRPFLSLFKGRKLDDTNWKVSKEGGDIDEITAATVSSRAVVEAVNTALAANSAE